MEYRMKDRRGKEQTEDDMNTGTAKTELQDEDWKTAIAQKKTDNPGRSNSEDNRNVAKYVWGFYKSGVQRSKIHSRTA